MGEQESITAYMAELRRLASTCDFGAFLEEALRDRLVCGLANESIQKRLLTEANLTLKKALELSLGMELAAKDATELQNKGATGLNRVAPGGHSTFFQVGVCGPDFRSVGLAN